MASSDEITRRLQAGIAAARRGDRLSARRTLESVIRDEPRNEQAWLWLATVAETRAERRESLEHVLKINPQNPRAKEALAQMERGGGSGAVAGGETPTGERPAGGGGLNPLNLLLGVGLAFAFVAALAFITINNQNSGAGGPTPLPPTPRPTIPRPPTQNIVVVPLEQVTREGPTLQPTWTPTMTPSPTLTPTPEATSVPLVEFDVLFTSLTEGAVAPDLYRLSGDGSDSRLLLEGVREAVYDPSGRRVVFVRDVTYSGADITGEEFEAEEGEDGEDGETSPAEVTTFTGPELFVADRDDLDNAVQVTQMRANIVGSPSWSPDGEFIVFVSDQDGDEDLWLIESDGGGLRKLTNNDFADRDPAWSPVLGSQQIVFASDFESPGRTELYSFELVEPGAEPVFVQLTDASNTSYQPSWSPRGDFIVFVSDRRSDPDLYLLDLSLGGVTLLTVNDGGAEDRRPSFTPDGRWVAFISNREDDRFQSYLIAIDGDVLTRLTNNEGNDATIHYRPELRLRLEG